MTNSLFMMDHQTTNFNPTYRSYTQSQQNLMWSCDLNTGVFETANTGGLQYPTAFTAAFPGETQNLAVTDNGGPYLKSVNTYENGFEMTFDYAFDRTRGDQYGYVQADTNGNGDCSDENRKVSFVANSGIKLGGIGGASTGIPEVAIIDMDAMVQKVWELDAETDARKACDDPVTYFKSRIDASGSVVSGGGKFVSEPLTKLLNGIRYGSKHTGNNGDDGANNGIVMSVAADGTPNFFAEETYSYTDLFDTFWAKRNENSVKITWTPSTSGSNVGCLIVYVNNVKTYQENGVNIGDDLSYLYVQTHWGSGVTISNVDITSY